MLCYFQVYDTVIQHLRTSPGAHRDRCPPSFPVTLVPHLPMPSPLVTFSLFSTVKSLFLGFISLSLISLCLLVLFLKFHRVKLYVFVFLTGLLHLAFSSPAPILSLHMARFHSFSGLSNSPLCIYSTSF